jgi:hypothetical protein
MFLENFKKFTAAFCFVLLFAGAASAASQSSALIKEEGEASEYTKSVPGGFEVEYRGIWKKDNTLDVFYKITASRDGRFSVEFHNSKVKDSNDIVVTANNGYRNDKERIKAGVWINDKQSDYAEAKGGQSYQVLIRYWVDETYLLTPELPYVSIAVNGLLAEFTNVPVAP